MKALDYFRLLGVLLVSQVVLTIFLTVRINKGPTSLEMSNFKCSCFQNNEEHTQVPEAPIRLPKEHAQDFERNDLNINLTIIANVNETSSLSADRWLESLGRLHIPCRVKLVFEDGVIEPRLKSNVENAVYGDKMAVKLIPINTELKEPPPLLFWNQLFKIILDELLQERDILYVDVQSIWINNPVPLIWKTYRSFDMWVAQEVDRAKVDTRFIFMKSALLNLRFINEWRSLLNGPSAGTTDSSKIYFQKSIERLKKTHKFKVEEFDFVKFPIRKEYTPEWIQFNRNDVYVIYGANLEDVDLVKGDSATQDVVEKKILDGNTGLPDPIKRENVTILAVTNSGFVDFTKNWLQSLFLLDKTFRVKVLTEDEKSLTALKNVAFYLKNSKMKLSVESERNSTDKALKYYTKSYLDFVNARPQSVLREMMEGQDVLFVDIDAVWLKDPLPLIWSQYSMYDVFVATGHDQKTPCPCFLYLKNSMLNIRMVNDWFKRLQRVNASPMRAKHENDMDALAKILYKYSTRAKYNTRVHKLSSIQFPTGELYFKTPNFYDNHKNDVYVVHGNRLGKHNKKLFFFKLLHLWYADNWDYRNSPIVRSD